MLILALVEDGPRHGYEIGKLIEQRSRGVLRFHIASLYPTLYRLEKGGLVKGAWEKTSGGRRRRFYRITQEGSNALAVKRKLWRAFVGALDRVARIRYA